jgi:hypothetical protein
MYNRGQRMGKNQTQYSLIYKKSIQRSKQRLLALPVRLNISSNPAFNHVQTGLHEMVFKHQCSSNNDCTLKES